jgi:hypothetical protein
LSDSQVLAELRATMLSHNYSWYTISNSLQSNLESQRLVIEHFEPGNILYEWNVLCDEGIHWQHHERPTFRNATFNRECLLLLRITPTQAGLGRIDKYICLTCFPNTDPRIQIGQKLATMNLDPHPIHTNLAVDFPGKQELEEFRTGYRGCNGMFTRRVQSFEWIMFMIEWNIEG